MPLVYPAESDNYGTYFMECIGVVDFLEIGTKMELDAIMAWTRKFHPVRFFPACCLVKVAEHIDPDNNLKGVNRYAVFVPSKRLNLDWDATFWNTKYQRPNRKTALPIQVSDKDIQRWQSSLPERLVPDYFKKARALEGLQVCLSEAMTPIDANAKAIESKIEWSDI